MENKITFGSFILHRRKELGMTQKEFASKLFVTESAVSKWERGLSYPDITLLQNICAVLEISEHELLSGGEDTKQRNSDRLAAKYLRLTRNFRLTQYIIYGAVLLTCFVVNLCTSHSLSWFFIVLASVMTAASLTLVPALCAVEAKLERWKGTICFGSFVLSLELLLLTCAIYCRQSWFPVAGIAVFFGLCTVCLPFLLPKAPLPDKLDGCKLSLYIGIETVLLLLLLLVSCLYTHGNWFIVAAVSVLFGLGLFLLPVSLRQLDLPKWASRCKLSLYIGIETVLLLLLLLISCLYTHGDWFIIAAVSVLFGLGLFLLPVLLRQLVLTKWISDNKTLTYFVVETVLLLLVVFLGQLYVGDPHLLFGLSLTMLILTLPWGIMAALRYLPVNGYYRASAACGWTSLCIWTMPWLAKLLTVWSYGDAEGWNYDLTTPFRAAEWRRGFSGSSWMTDGLIIIIFALAAVALACIGFKKGEKERDD